MKTKVLKEKVDVRKKRQRKMQGCETPLDADSQLDYSTDVNDLICRLYKDHEQHEIREFAEELAYRIRMRERGEFFRLSHSNSGKQKNYDEQENDEVRQREARGDREFDYQGAIPVLIENLAKMNPEERRKITEEVKQGTDYRKSGIYVSCNGNRNAPLLADVAEDPQCYFDRFLFAPTLNRIIGMQKNRLHDTLDMTIDAFVEKEDNEKLKQKEASRGREFDYEKFIPILLENLAKMSSEERSRTRQGISLGTRYTINGVVVNINWRDYPFADVAENPLKYFNGCYQT